MKVSGPTNIRAFVAIFVLVLAGPALLAGPGRSRDKKILSRLKTGTPVKVGGKKVKVSRLNDLLKKQVNVELACIADFDRPDRSALKQTIAIRSPVPLWTAIRAVQEKTGLLLQKIESDKIELSREVLFSKNEAPAADPLVVGSFLIVPTVDSFFDELKIDVCPEPWLTGIAVTRWSAIATLDDGKKVPWKPSIASANPNSRGLIELDFSKTFARGAKKAKRLALEIDLRVPVSVKQFLSPVISSVAPKETEVGSSGRIRIIELGVVETKGREQIAVRLNSNGDVLAGDKVRLVTRDGTRHAPVSSGESGESSHQFLFDAEDVGSKTSGLDLEVTFTKLKQIKLGMFGAIKGKTKKAALSRVKIVGATARKSQLDVKLEVSGEKIPFDEVALVRRGRRIDNNGYTSEKINGIWHATLWFRKSRVKDLKSCALVVKAPESFETTVIKNLAKIAAKPFAAGAAKIRVVSLGANPETDGDPSHRIGLEITGATLSPTSLVVLDSRNSPIAKEGWSSGSGGDNTQHLELMFSPAEVGKTRLERCRIQIPAPTRVITHTLKTTLEDVKLRP